MSHVFACSVYHQRMHTHVSLFEGEKNAFYDAKAEYNLSKVGRSFIAGLLRHAPEITAVTNQWVNSYKRLHGGGEAPALVNWGHNNRAALVRVPMYKPKNENSTRVEFRSPDSACNPYLAYAVMIAAGLKGVEEGYELSDSTDVTTLPSNLNEAITAMEKRSVPRKINATQINPKPTTRPVVIFSWLTKVPIINMIVGVMY